MTQAIIDVGIARVSQRDALASEDRQRREQQRVQHTV
jgi:hypothetical protein